MANNDVESEIGNSKAALEVQPSGLPSANDKQQPPNDTLQPVQPTQNSGKNTKNYIIVITLVIVILAIAAYTLTSQSTTPPIQSTTSLPTTVSRASVLTAVTGSGFVLSGIPYASNMSSYFSYSNYSMDVEQYGFPFTKLLIASSILPANYTLSVPKAFSNLPSPIMVFVNVSDYPNATSAKYRYDVLRALITNTTTYQPGPVNNSISYSTKLYNLSLIGTAFQYKNYISITVTWGNVNKFTNSSYASSIAENQYSFLSKNT